MRASEILRKLADVIDAKDSGQSQTQVTNRPEVVDVEVSEPVDTHGIEGQAQVNTRSMVAPLQQKLDIMKKLAGVEVPHTDVAIDGDEGHCSACGCEPCECEPDELSIMRQNAGIKPAVIAIADEDEPFEG